jgi:hypothetical protein
MYRHIRTSIRQIHDCSSILTGIVVAQGLKKCDKQARDMHVYKQHDDQAKNDENNRITYKSVT